MRMAPMVNRIVNRTVNQTEAEAEAKAEANGKEVNGKEVLSFAGTPTCSIRRLP